MKGALSSDAVLVPTSFVADTRHKYVNPFTSPETVMGEVGLSVEDKSAMPLPHKAVKLVTGEPPSSATLILMDA
jgi:hypothetical protein